MRLSKLIGVTWRSACRILQRIRKAMGNQDSIYRLTQIIELDDAMVGGKKPGKRGRGAQGKVSVLIACENREDRAGFVAMEAVASINKEAILDFSKRRIKASQVVRTDGLPANKGLQSHVTHIARVTPPEIATQWLPWVHIVIANLKRFLLGTFHGASHRYLQD